MTPEERTAKWIAYYERTASEPPRASLIRALELFGDEPPGLAVDLGCGGGRDTLELLERGWSVVAVDREPAATERVASIVPPEHAARLRTLAEPLETVEIPPCTLVNASYSLPFCAPEHFDAMWSRVSAAIVPGGRFAGQIFGDRDEWRDNPELTFRTREETEALFDGFAIEELTEIDEDGTTSMGEMKHWHVFTVIARKLEDGVRS
jgi:tellurite methyltransferase